MDFNNSISEKIEGENLILRVHENLNDEVANSLVNQFNNSNSSRNFNKVYINIENCNIISSLAIGKILRIYRQLLKDKKEMIICSPKFYIKELLLSIKLDLLMKIE